MSGISKSHILQMAKELLVPGTSCDNSNIIGSGCRFKVTGSNFYWKDNELYIKYDSVREGGNYTVWKEGKWCSSTVTEEHLKKTEELTRIREFLEKE